MNNNSFQHQQMLLSAFNDLKAKTYLIFRCKCDTLDPAVQQPSEWLSFNWKTYVSSSSSSTWTESPAWWSTVSWDHQWQEWHSRVARQRMVGPAITTTTPESRTNEYQETCTERSEQKTLNCRQVCRQHTCLCARMRTFFLLHA